MAMDPALEEKLSEIIEQEREMGAGAEATKLEQMVEDQESASAPGSLGDDALAMDDPGEAATGEGATELPEDPDQGTGATG